MAKSAITLTCDYFERRHTWRKTGVEFDFWCCDQEGKGKYDGKNWWFGKDEGILFKRKAAGLQ